MPAKTKNPDIPIESSSSDRNRFGHSSTAKLLGLEWLTLGLLGAVWILWLLLTWLIGHESWWPALVLLIPTVTLHSSLTHEALHGHPTPYPWLNELLLTMNPGLFVPYGAFRDSHLAHHQTSQLTNPLTDTESFYLAPGQWQQMGRAQRALYRVNATLLGRLAVGPVLILVRFYHSEADRIAKNQGTSRRDWLTHLLGLLALIYWLNTVCSFPFIGYLLIVAYPAYSLLMLRTFAEHRESPTQAMRSVIIESSWPLSVIFLNNNLHAVHHAQPQTPWYRLPSLYQARRETILKENGDYFFKGYRSLFRRYALCPVEALMKAAR